MRTLDLNSCNAIDLIDWCAKRKQKSFHDAMQKSMDIDNAFADSLSPAEEEVRTSVLSRRDATRDAMAAIEKGDFDWFAENMGAGHVILNIASKLQRLTRDEQTAIAIRT